VQQLHEDWSLLTASRSNMMPVSSASLEIRLERCPRLVRRHVQFLVLFTLAWN
jgi:hypothetical protein